MSAQISIVIPVFNKCDYTKKCLESIFQTVSCQINFRVIVVNNGSTDGTDAVLGNFPQVIVINNNENLGFSKACNIGAAVSTSPMILFLNNDIVATPGWIEPLINILKSNHDIGIVGSKLLYPEGQIQHAGVVICSGGVPSHIYVGFPSDHLAVNKMREFQVVTAACLLIKRSVFSLVGGFDEEYINGYEDVDLCLKVREAGYQVIYNPKSVLYHYESKSEGRFDHVDHNCRIFKKKWLGKLSPDDYKYYFCDGMLSLTFDGGGKHSLIVSPDMPLNKIILPNQEPFEMQKNGNEVAVEEEINNISPLPKKKSSIGAMIKWTMKNEGIWGVIKRTISYIYRMGFKA